MTTDVLLNLFPVKARKETDSAHQGLRDMIEQFTLMCAAIIFPTTVIAAAVADVVEVDVITADANDVRMLFGGNKVKSVTVTADSGTAAGREVSADGVTYGASAVIDLVRGYGKVYARVSGAGTHVLALSDSAGSGLTLGGNATITFA